MYAEGDARANTECKSGTETRADGRQKELNEIIELFEVPEETQCLSLVPNKRYVTVGERPETRFIRRKPNRDPAGANVCRRTSRRAKPRHFYSKTNYTELYTCVRLKGYPVCTYYILFDPLTYHRLIVQIYEGLTAGHCDNRASPFFFFFENHFLTDTNASFNYDQCCSRTRYIK